ncbi:MULTISPECIES: type II toxin-antitoxin system RelB/DinJ family antitoxin [unclassified Adlercreutzia]|uniref:type II toxin-antitoxin system RelB/DinJ family antitoxin n=1 Tax=unclassified Adlercreutzia TaxID=2636013 RepID=UPI0013ED212E|nr:MULTISPECIES: type II toxin-antitoxin system RelB/DinJ family antitoxin [unclassified Adlercreutzia]
MSTMTIRCDEADKRAAAEVAEYYGFDLSSVTRAFWKQMARTRSIPLELGGREPNAESVRSIREADAIVAAEGTGESYDTARSLLDAARA